MQAKETNTTIIAQVSQRKLNNLSNHVVASILTELTEEEYAERLRTSTTLYVGNLSFFTLES